MGGLSVRCRRKISRINLHIIEIFMSVLEADLRMLSIEFMLSYETHIIIFKFEEQMLLTVFFVRTSVSCISQFLSDLRWCLRNFCALRNMYRTKI